MAHRLAIHDELLQSVVRPPRFPHGQVVGILLVETAVHVFRVMDEARGGKRLHGLRLFRRRPAAEPYQQRIFQFVQYVRLRHFRLQTAVDVIGRGVIRHRIPYVTIIERQTQYRRRP